MVEQIYCIPGTTCNKIPLEKRKIMKKTISVSLRWIIFIIFFLVFFGINFFSHPDTSGSGILMFVSFMLILLLIILFLCTLIYQIFYYKNYFYDLKSDEIIIRKGVISRIEISLPYEKIQNVYVDQDILDRMFHLYDVHLETAGGQSGAVAHIDGVSGQGSKQLRDMFMSSLKKSGKRRKDGV